MSRRFFAGDISGAGPLLYVLDGGMKEGGLNVFFQNWERP